MKIRKLKPTLSLTADAQKKQVGGAEPHIVQISSIFPFVLILFHEKLVHILGQDFHDSITFDLFF